MDKLSIENNININNVININIEKKIIKIKIK